LGELLGGRVGAPARFGELVRHGAQPAGNRGVPAGRFECQDRLQRLVNAGQVASQ